LRLAPSAGSRLIRGERQMKLLEAVQIADFLGVSQEEVLRHADEGTIPPSGGEVIAETLDRLIDEAGRDERASFAALGVYGGMNENFVLVAGRSRWQADGV